MLRKIALLILLFFLAANVTGCGITANTNGSSGGGGSTPLVFGITYHANEATVGTVPAAQTGAYNTTVNVHENSGNLLRAPIGAEAFKFGGWNTEPDGHGDNYDPDDEITITGNIILYAKWVSFELRNIGPAGGLIFYDKGSYSDGWRYLEAAPQSTEWTDKEWGVSGNLLHGTEPEIGTGINNTLLIVAELNAAPAEFDRAAQLCDGLTHADYEDWFLPSRDELNEMCWILHSRKYLHPNTEDNPTYGDNRVGGFADDRYWSSSQHDMDSSRYQNFDNGLSGANLKSEKRRVRAIRAF